MEKLRLGMSTAFGAIWATGEATLNSILLQSNRIIDGCPYHTERLKQIILNLEEKTLLNLKNKQSPPEINVITKMKEEKLNAMLEKFNKLHNEFSVTPSYAFKFLDTVKAENVILIGVKELSFIVTNNQNTRKKQMDNIISDYNNSVIALLNLEKELYDFNLNFNEII